MTRLYGHSQNLTAAIPLIRQMRPEYWKILGRNEDLAAIKECRALGVRLIVRVYPEPQLDAVTFVNTARSQEWWPYVWAVETPNEANRSDAAYVQFESQVVMHLAAYGKQCIVNNDAAGHDGHYVPGAMYFGIHEYWDPPFIQERPWLATRYRSWFPEIRKRNPQAMLFITECGYTALRREPPPPDPEGAPHGADIGFRGGYGIEGVLEDSYLASLKTYAADISADPYVLGAFIYETGAFDDWGSFEVLDTTIDTWMANQISAHPSTPQPHSGGHGGTMPDYVIGQGIRDKAAQIGATHPIMDEEYLKDGQGKDTYSYAIYDNGKMMWEIRYYPKLNRTYAVRLV